ncbi:uncharacterized protein LOC106672161 [Cimex lectularius]|uniref:Uncharacterized protein n=1 Tax=Cimex lectularius TaxID=79782 RepID=A0A8I6S6N0_CIMLE|nr:uncharacterized protein LOC106672161 [Cimex lectularius]
MRSGDGKFLEREENDSLEKGPWAVGKREEEVVRRGRGSIHASIGRALPQSVTRRRPISFVPVFQQPSTFTVGSAPPPTRRGLPMSCRAEQKKAVFPTLALHDHSHTHDHSHNHVERPKKLAHQPKSKSESKDSPEKEKTEAHAKQKHKNKSDNK